MKILEEMFPKKEAKISRAFMPCAIELLSMHFSQSKSFLYDICMYCNYTLYIIELKIRTSPRNDKCYLYNQIQGQNQSRKNTEQSTIDRHATKTDKTPC